MFYVQCSWCKQRDSQNFVCSLTHKAQTNNTRCVQTIAKSGAQERSPLFIIAKIKVAATPPTANFNYIVSRVTMCNITFISGLRQTSHHIKVFHYYNSTRNRANSLRCNASLHSLIQWSALAGLYQKWFSFWADRFLGQRLQTTYLPHIEIGIFSFNSNNCAITPTVHAIFVLRTKKLYDYNSTIVRNNYHDHD